MEKGMSCDESFVCVGRCHQWEQKELGSGKLRPAASFSQVASLMLAILESIVKKHHSLIMLPQVHVLKSALTRMYTFIVLFI